MKRKFVYRVSKYEIEDASKNVLGESGFSSSLFVGLRLEDLKSTDDALKAGFRKVDEITYVRESFESGEASVRDMCSIFISSYIFQGGVKSICDFSKIKCDAGKFIKDLIVGPLNQLRYKNENIEFVADESVYASVDRIVMLDSMEPIFLVLDKIS